MTPSRKYTVDSDQVDGQAYILDCSHLNCAEKSSLVSSSSQLSSQRCCVEPSVAAASVSSCAQSVAPVYQQMFHNISCTLSTPLLFGFSLLGAFGYPRGAGRRNQLGMKRKRGEWEAYHRQGNPRIHHPPLGPRLTSVACPPAWTRPMPISRWWVLWSLRLMKPCLRSLLMVVCWV